VQQDRYVLHVVLHVGGGAHDQRRGYQGLLLEAVVRVHPVRARAGREVVSPDGSWLEEQAACLGDAVLEERRGLAMPVDDRGI